MEFLVATTLVFVGGVAVPSGDTTRVLLRAHPPRGTLVRCLVRSEQVFGGRVIEGPRALGSLGFYTLAVTADSADTVTLAITIDSTFLLEDKRLVPMGRTGRPTAFVVATDTRRLRIMGDSTSRLAARTLFDTQPLLPERPVRRGESWETPLEFDIPTSGPLNGALHGKVKTKLQEIRVADGDTTVVLTFSISGEGDVQVPAAGMVERQTYFASFHGKETLSLTRGVSVELTMDGTYTMRARISGGLRSDLENRIHVERRLLVNP